MKTTLLAPPLREGLVSGFLVVLDPDGEAIPVRTRYKEKVEYFLAKGSSSIGGAEYFTLVKSGMLPEERVKGYNPDMVVWKTMARKEACLGCGAAEWFYGERPQNYGGYRCEKCASKR